MRHVEKNFEDIPQSLKPATKAFFQDENYPEDARKTHDVRKKMIQQGVYIKEADSLYKADDVKEKLETLYLNKCAYCEQYIESYHVEHYRPKRAFTYSTAQKHSGYHWMSLSWDNLMLACPKCNEKKGNKFNIKGTRITHESAPQSDEGWNNITHLSAKCDELEKPLILNPEKVNPENHLHFSIDGCIHGKTEEGKYTIDVCGLDRKQLNDDRRRIVDQLVHRLVGILIRYANRPEDCDERIIDELVQFDSELSDINEPFTLFRKNTTEWYSELLEKAKEKYKIDIQ